MTSISRLWTKLRRRKYRQAFVATQLKRGVPLQIQALRKRLRLTQKQLAERAGLKQGTISRCEDPDYGELTFNTVLAIANGLDVAFVGKFVPFSELVKWHENLFEHANEVSTFGEEDAQGALGNVAALIPTMDGQTPSPQSSGTPPISQLLTRQALTANEALPAVRGQGMDLSSGELLVGRASV